MFNMFKKQGTSKRSASTSMIGDREPGFVATPTGEGAMACWACEELVELDEVELATVVGGDGVSVSIRPKFFDQEKGFGFIIPDASADAVVFGG